MKTSHVERRLQFIANELKSSNTIEIAINTDGSVWIERAGDAHMMHLKDMEQPKEIIGLMSSLAGQADEKESARKPIISSSLKIGDQDVRLQMVGHKVVDQNAAMTFRLQPKKTFPLEAFPMLHGKSYVGDTLRLEKQKKLKTILDHDGHEKALVHAVKNKLNILISGGTSTAKTSLLRTLLMHADETDRVITIEDSYEILPEHKNKLMLRASRDPKDPNNYPEMLAAVLRLRPDRIVVGELRGIEAMTYLRGIRSGHGGSMTSIHAESTSIAISQLALMIAESGGAIPFDRLEDIVRQSIDIVVQLDRTEDGQRGIEGIEFLGLSG